MEEDPTSIPVNTRLPTGLVQEIDGLVSEHKFRSRGDFVLSAVRHYLDHMTVDRHFTKVEPPDQPSFEELAKSRRDRPDTP